MTVYRRRDNKWTSAGESNCGVESYIVVSTRTRSGVNDFYCGGERFAWNGTEYRFIEDEEEDVTATKPVDARTDPDARSSSSVPNSANAANALPSPAPSATARGLTMPRGSSPPAVPFASPPKPNPQPKPRRNPSAKVRMVVIGKSSIGYVRVREKPDGDSRVVTTVRPGERYAASRVVDGWYRIDQKHGWVAGPYVR